jgi:hypothetical protein
VHQDAPRLASTATAKTAELWACRLQLSPHEWPVRVLVVRNAPVWLADKGWDEAEAVKIAAGDKGSAVHLAIERILNGEEFRIDTKVEDKARSTEQAAMRDLTYEEHPLRTLPRSNAKLQRTRTSIPMKRPTQQERILVVLGQLHDGTHQIPPEYIRRHPKGDGVSVRYFKRVLWITEVNGRVSELRGKGYDIQSSTERDPFGFVYLRLVS